MPLDGGDVAEAELDGALDRDPASTDSVQPTVHSGADIGEALRAIREFQGRSIEEVAESTRVRRAYLAAIEDMRLEVLPSRPFTIGYIRAYAEALGVDPEAAAYRFKADEPVLEEPLHEPVGVGYEKDPRLSALVAGGVIILVAIILWNVAQRAMSESAPPSPTAPQKATERALRAQKPGLVILGAPLPPPVESTTPPPYETPGLAEAGEDGMGSVGQLAITGGPEIAPPAEVAALTPTFTPKGKVYGAPAGQPSYVTLQALRSAALVVHGADGSVYFARQMDKGEAYRIPLVGGLVVDVSEPRSFQVFAAGQSRGFLPAPQSAAGQLGG